MKIKKSSWHYRLVYGAIGTPPENIYGYFFMVAVFTFSFLSIAWMVIVLTAIFVSSVLDQPILAGKYMLFAGLIFLIVRLVIKAKKRYCNQIEFVDE